MTNSSPAIWKASANYDLTIVHLKKHHPLCKEKGISDEYKDYIASSVVNGLIRKLISSKQEAAYSIPNMCVAIKLRSGAILLSVIVR